MPLNQFKQPVGEHLSDVSLGKLPQVKCLQGRYCSVEHINAKEHLDDIAVFYYEKAIPSDWTYMMTDPFTSKAAVKACLEDYERSQNPYFFAIREKESGKILGTFSLMRIDPKNRVVEMGRVIYAPALQKTRAATESQYLVMAYVFEELGYRRYEWKCDRLNQPSVKAAKRLGFTYEGTFRKHVIYKGRTRDTDWLSILDNEWPANKARLEKWLRPENFDQKGQQIKSLGEF